MRRSFRWFGLACVLVLVGGCASGVVASKGERMNTYKRVVDMDLRQLADDWDYVWLMDRQYRLTRYHIR